MNLAPYRKLLVSLLTPLIGAAILAVNNFAGIDMSPATADLVNAAATLIAVLGSAVSGGVYAVSNAPVAVSDVSGVPLETVKEGAKATVAVLDRAGDGEVVPDGARGDEHQKDVKALARSMV